jgi:hypothetical protein
MLIIEYGVPGMLWCPRNVITKDWKGSVQAVLRDFRNYVHPRKELQSVDKITEGEAYQSVGALMRIIDHIVKNHP